MRPTVVTSSHLWQIGFSVLLCFLKEIEPGVIRRSNDGSDAVVPKHSVTGEWSEGNATLGLSQESSAVTPNIQSSPSLSGFENSEYSVMENTKKVEVLASEHLESEHLLGRRVLLTCLAKGTPLPQVHWLKENVLVYPHNYLQVHSWESEKGFTRSVLIVDPATWMDNGSYECLAFNGFTSHSKTFFLTFGDKL